jgi:hypothetical protein
MRFSFVGGSYQARAGDCQRTINLYPEALESGSGKSPMVLHGTPGTVLWQALPTGPVRGFNNCNGRVIVAVGAALYEVFDGPTYTLLGAIAAGTDPVSIAGNGTQWFVCSQNHGYLWNGTTLTAGVPTAPSQVVFVDGYFVAFDNETQQFRISELYDGATWAALDFSSAEGEPDDLVSMLSDHRELWMFGNRSAEIFVNTGNANFPFERIQGAFIEQGCGAKDSPVKQDNSIFWLGEDNRGGRIFWRANGYTPVRVSTHAVEYAWSQYPRIDDAYSFAYSEAGHSFIQITFPTAYAMPSDVYRGPQVYGGATWVLDCATGLWHERAEWDATHGIWKQHRAMCHVYAFDKHFVGDRENGNIYEMGMSLLDDNGTQIRRERIGPHIYSEGKMLFHKEFVLDMEVGVGLTTGQGSDPMVMLQFSDDGGKTWGNEHWATAGKIGAYKTRVRWTRLGRSRDRVYKVAMADPVKWSIIDGYAEVEAEAA